MGQKLIYAKFSKTEYRRVIDLLKEGFSTDNGNFIRTYNDPECTDQECHAARRSLEDLLSIVRVYFPRCSRQRLCKALYRLKDDPEMYVYAYKCRTIHKIVYRANRNMGFAVERGFNSSVRETDEYKGNGEYSMIEFLEYARR